MHCKTPATLGLALALAAAGCGGSKPLTSMQFVQRAEAICLHAHAQGIAMLQAVAAREKTEHLSQAQLTAQFLPRVAALERQQLKELEKLRPPHQLQTTFTQWKQAVDQEINRPHQTTPPTGTKHAQLLATATRREQLKNTLGIKTQCA